MGCAGPAFAQAPVVTVEDYARAEKFLAHNAKPLVDHAIEPVHWIDDAQFWYRDHDANGDRFLRMDAAHGGVVPAFDHVKLAAALAKASGKEVKAEKLPLGDWSRADDGRLDVTASGKHYLCDLSGKGACEAKPEPKEPAVLSPDKTREAFIRDWNLWVRDTATGKETQLTTDGVKDYGYATDNAGWKHTDTAILVWSQASTKIATFRQAQRRTSTMTLVGTDVGAPQLAPGNATSVGSAPAP